MPEGSLAQNVIPKITSSDDPIITGLTFTLAVVIILVAISRPIMSLVREKSSTAVNSAKASAESVLFEQLQHQIKLNTEAIDKLLIERNALFEKSVRLEFEVQRLQSFEARFETMKARLEEKDRIIEERDLEIRKLNNHILQMTERIHSLEMRLLQDERLLCIKANDCPEKVTEKLR